MFKFDKFVFSQIYGDFFCEFNGFSADFIMEFFV